MFKKKFITTVIVLIVLLIIPFIGLIDIPLKNVFKETQVGFIFWQLRIPRMLLGFISGSMLALSGLIFQSLFRNGLATPYTLGVASGAAAGAVSAIKFNLLLPIFGVSGIFPFGILGAMLSIFILVGITRILRSHSIYTLLMSGVAINFLFASIIVLIQYISDFSNTFSLLRWLMGGIDISGYREVKLLLPLFILFFGLVYVFKNELVLVSAGDRFAHGKGLDVQKFRMATFVTVSFMVGMVVSMIGPIGFVGLIVPHVSRLISKNRFNHTIFFTALLGGALLSIADFISRILIPPVEVPVGIVTAFMGSPFFLLVLVSTLKRKT